MSGAERRFVPDQGWSWVVLVAAFLSNVTFDGIIFSFGVLYLELLEEFGKSKSTTSWIGAVIVGVYAVVGPLASVLSNKFGYRTMTIAGAFTSSAGFILSSYSPNIGVMIITYSIMGGLGFGHMYLCAYVMIGDYFDKRRALATGIASCGSGVGTFIFAPLTNYLITEYTWKGTMWILAGIILNGVVYGAVFRPVPHVTHEEDETTSKRQLMDWSIFKMPAFLILCASSFLCMIGFYVPFIYLIDYARDVGIEPKEGAFLFSIIGISNTVARILCGYVSDKSWADPLKIYNWALIIGGLATVFTTWLTSFALLSCYACIFGLCLACYVSLNAILLVEFLGLKRLSNSFGFINLFRGIATLIGSPLAGVLFELTGSYREAFCTAGVTIASAGVICLPLRYTIKCYNQRRSNLHVTIIDKPASQTDLNMVSKRETHRAASAPNLGSDAVRRSANWFTSRVLLSSSHWLVGLPPNICSSPGNDIDMQHTSTVHIQTQHSSKLELIHTFGHRVTDVDNIRLILTQDTAVAVNSVTRHRRHSVP